MQHDPLALEIAAGGDGAADFERLSELEWLETNGLGGWAGSTLSGAHTRRYHGLLVAATAPPVGRKVLVSKLDETVRAGGESRELGSNRYPGAVHPGGFRRLRRFRRGLFPVFEYEIGGRRLSKTVAAVSGENTTLVLYELEEGGEAVELELRPFLTWRDFHALGPGTELLQVAELRDEVLVSRLHPQGPDVFIRFPGARFEAAPGWYHRFELAAERERGLDFQEDLWTPGVLVARLEAGARVGIIVSTADPRGREAAELLEGERRRRLKLFGGMAPDDLGGRRLVLAADQFIVRRGAERRTVIAGYHWFADWGRDTMIALPGLCLVTGRHAEARDVLRAFAESVDRGMLPNRFPDEGETPEYNTVDATLWFFVAIHRYLEATGDEEFVRGELLAVLRDILAWHERGTRYGIRVDGDGLLLAGEPGVQLTWMDAKVGDWVVTPRQGKAVEINALWFNALKILSTLEGRLGAAAAGAELERRAERVRRRFNRLFWNEERGCLYDVVDGDRRDDSLRPNQVIVLGLPFPALSLARSRKVLRIAEQTLLTPVGLRSLSADHPDYRPVYRGGPLERDGSYHQGTVWGWLLGPYCTALLRYRRGGADAARRLLDRALEHLAEAGVGTCSEIFDAEPPHRPRGAVAQAWTVAELLRARAELQQAAK